MTGIALVVACLLGGLFAPAPAHAQDATGSLGPLGQEIAQAINAVRTQNGLAPLVVHPLLNLAAQNHVDDLIANGMYGHYGSDGSNVKSRVLRTGYPSGWVSENWVTSRSAGSAMDWWMNDWIHRVNILDASWDEVGIGVGQVRNGYYIFVTDFANVDGKDTYVTAPAPQAAPAAQAAPSAKAEPRAPEIVPGQGGEYTVRPGDTLLAIGLRYGVEWQDIAHANGMGEKDVLRVGKVLKIPGHETAAATNVPAGGKLYTVQTGDTLSGIAGRYDIGWRDIASANRLGEYTVLQIGMQLRLPGVLEDAAESTATAAADDGATGGTASAPAPSYTTELINVTPAYVARSGANTAAAALSVTTDLGFGGTAPTGTPYTVKAGDTLFSIASRNGVTWQQLADANGLREDAFLQIGQTLTLPAKPNIGAAAVLVPPTPMEAILTPARTYTVKAGDTIISIAAKNGIGWKELLSINGLGDDSVLQVGQVLKLGN
jgi:LysM repeat protein